MLLADVEKAGSAHVLVRRFGNWVYWPWSLSSRLDRNESAPRMALDPMDPSDVTGFFSLL